MSDILQFPSGNKIPGYVSRNTRIKNFSVIAAVALNGVIGNSVSNSIPWHLPTDFKWFKDATSGKTVVMGSRTYESIKRPLPKRRNVVITSNFDKAIRYHTEGVDMVYADPYSALQYENEVFVIGGQGIYAAALDLAPLNLFITIVNKDAEGDVYFPITGDNFHDDVVYHNDVRYECKYRSEWHTENETEFQMTRFERA